MSRRPAVPCKARTSSGRACRRFAMHGQQVCPSHGGRAPQAKAAAARRQTEAQALRALERAGARSIENPLEELQRLASEIVGVKDWLGERVEKLQEIRSGGDVEQIRAELAAYERALDRCTRVLSEIARLDIDERLARVTEQQAHRQMQIGAHVMQAAFAFVFGRVPLPAEMRVVGHIGGDGPRRESLGNAVARLGLRIVGASTVDAATREVKMPALGDLSDPDREFVRWLRQRWADVTRIPELEMKVSTLETQLAGEVRLRVEAEERVRQWSSQRASGRELPARHSLAIEAGP